MGEREGFPAWDETTEMARLRELVRQYQDEIVPALRAEVEERKALQSLTAAEADAQKERADEAERELNALKLRDADGYAELLKEHDALREAAQEVADAILAFDSAAEQAVADPDPADHIPYWHDRLRAALDAAGRE